MKEPRKVTVDKLMLLIKGHLHINLVLRNSLFEMQPYVNVNFYLILLAFFEERKSKNLTVDKFNKN